MVKKISITSDFVTLGQFLKIADLVDSGGQAKFFLSENEVIINDEIDNRRGRKLRDGDEITIKGNTYRIIQDAN